MFDQSKLLERFIRASKLEHLNTGRWGFLEAKRCQLFHIQVKLRPKTGCPFGCTRLSKG